MSRVIIEFPDEDAASRFLAWFSDGGGEYQFFESEEIHAPDDFSRIANMKYHRAFPAWGYDPAKHGPDRVVVAKRHMDKAPDRTDGGGSTNG